MLTSRKPLVAAVVVAVAIAVAGCSNSGGPSQNVGGATSSPSSSPTIASKGYEYGGPSPSTVPAPTLSASGPTLLARTVGSNGTIIVAGNGMTVYTFTQDIPNDGKSACYGPCATIWPPVTVPSGKAPSAGPGATGKLGTIRRTDGTTQVTYNGLPLYFYHSDTKPGDTFGHYTGWNLVTP